VGIVAYSPLGRGFLADLATFANMDAGDWRRNNPRFREENLEENKKRVAKFYEIAQRKGCTPAQLALAWVHSQGDTIFPIPGTKSSTRIVENAGALLLLPLSPEELEAISHSVEMLIGTRY
jgi:aryl-alcohol dehydrogenase-like predicted oxidoreductase